jgi:hypothetical protein
MKKEDVRGASASAEWTGFRFSDDLSELFNAVSKANALFVKLTDEEIERWKAIGESPDVFGKAFSDAMEHNTKCIQSLSEYAKQLVEVEMFEKFKD